MNQLKFIETHEQRFLSEQTVIYKRLTAAMDRARKAIFQSAEIWQQAKRHFDVMGYSEKDVSKFARRIKTLRSFEVKANRFLESRINEAQEFQSRTCSEFSVVLAGTGINGTEGWTWNQRAALFSNCCCLKSEIRAARKLSAEIEPYEEVLLRRFLNLER